MGEPRSAMRFVGLDTVALLELVRAGDYEAYGELYTRYRDFADKIARRASRRHADDLVAESFRRVLTAISHGAGPTQAFGPYLAATIRSAAAGLAAPYQEVELDVNRLLTDEHGDVDPRVSTAYLSLPEQWQNALWYSDVEGLSPRHAAPLLGLASANAFSALRRRAHAGLRSAYLTQVVDEACNEEVRRHLEMLMAGTVSAELVDDLVDQHLRDCDECAAIAWRVAAVTGHKVGLVLAPALLAFHGFATSGALLPVGFGLPGVLGWLWRLPKSVAVAGTTAAVGSLAVATVAIGSMVGGGGDGRVSTPDGVASPIEPSTEPVTSDDTDDTESPLVEPDRDGADPPIGSDSSTTERRPVLTATTSTVPAGTPPPLAGEDAPTTGTTSTTSAPAVPTTLPVLGSTGGATTSPTTTLVLGTVGPSTSANSVATTTATTLPGAPSTTGVPTTTGAPATTSPTTTTTTTTSTTTTTTSTSTTTTTVAPDPPARLVVTFDQVVQENGQPRRMIRLEIVDTTGAAGTIQFSRPIGSISATRITCAPTGCTLAETTQDAFVIFRTAPGPLTIVLRDAGGTIVQTISLP